MLKVIFITIAAVVLIAIILMSIGKVAIFLFAKRRIAYAAAFAILWLSTFLYVVVISAGLGFIAYQFLPWLGWVVGIFWMVIFLIPSGGRSISSDARHSLEVARNRTQRPLKNTRDSNEG